MTSIEGILVTRKQVKINAADRSLADMSRVNTQGFSHQDPGFIDHLVNKKAEVVRVIVEHGEDMPEVREWKWHY